MQYRNPIFRRFFENFFEIIAIGIDFFTNNIYIFGAKYKNIE